MCLAVDKPRSQALSSSLPPLSRLGINMNFLLLSFQIFFSQALCMYDIFSPHLTCINVFFSTMLGWVFFNISGILYNFLGDFHTFHSKVKLFTPKFIVSFSTVGSLLKISEKLNEVVATARNMCNALTHCLDLLAQQEEVRLDSGFL